MIMNAEEVEQDYLGRDEEEGELGKVVKQLAIMTGLIVLGLMGIGCGILWL